MGVIATTKSDFYTKEQSLANKAKMLEIYKNYGEGIKWISHITNIPKNLLLPFVFIESAGNPNARNGNAIGLMQISPATVSDALVREFTRKRLNEEEEKILVKYLGDVWTKNKARMQKFNKPINSLGDTWIPSAVLYKPGFNLTVGAIYLGQLFDEFTDPNTGETRLDKVVAVYNMGRGGAKNVIATEGGVEAVLSSPSIPNETKNYIKKLLGPNGVYRNSAI